MKEKPEAHSQLKTLESFSESKALERLRELGMEHVLAAFEIPSENDADGKPIQNAEIFWVKLGVPPEAQGTPCALTVEGKVYFPKAGWNGETVIHTPGFPGGNAGRFEKIYAQAFIDAGYSFATSRHNGASLTNGETSLDILNSQKRMDIAKEAGEHHIGGTRPEGYGPSQMIYEPMNVICALAKRSNGIVLMGQSMGVASNYNSLSALAKHPETTDKVRNVVGISGYVGNTTETPDGIWNGMKQDFSATAQHESAYMDRVDLNAPRDGNWLAAELKKVAAQNEQMIVPLHVGNVLVYTPDDPLIAGPVREMENHAQKYGPKSKRKLIVEDRTMPADQAKKAHSMLWIAPENLVRAVGTKVSEHGPHFIRVPNTKGGALEKA